MCELEQIAEFITNCVIQTLDNNYSSKTVSGQYKDLAD